MVFCNKIKDNKDQAVYSMGCFTTNMTGLIVFYNDDRCYEVVKQPEGDTVARNWISKLYNLHREEFENNEFKERIAYQV